MRKRLVLFGAADVAQIANYYFEIDSDYEVVAFCVDRDYKTGTEFEGKPLVAFEEVARLFPPSEHEMFIALSYGQMNRLREAKYNHAKKMGYRIASYISSRCSYLSQYRPGDNAFIFEDNTVQPFVRIGENVTLWSGNHVGHHSEIASHNFVSSHVVISGHCKVNSYCFLGVNSTIAHTVEIASGTLVGAGAVITKNTEEGCIYVPPRAVKLENRRSDQVKL